MLGKLEFSFGGYEFFPSGRCLFYRILLESYAKDHKRGCMSQENSCSMGCSRLGEDEQEASWGNDKLKRESYAKRLTTLIQNTRGPYVIGLTSPWGSGKTFFLRAWKRDLSAQGKTCVYFNAWKNDIVDDPLASLMVTVQEQLGDEDKNSWQALWKFVPFISKNIAKVITAIDGGMTGATLEVGANIIDFIKKNAEENKNFQNELKSIADLHFKKGSNFPLFIMIDELDRCRPEYTIRLLECIKHLFQIPGIVFLLAVDATQLLLQVEHTFGLKKDPWEAEKIKKESTDPRIDYLGKFFDVYYSLPSPDIKSFVEIYLQEMDELTQYNGTYSDKTQIGLPELLTAEPSLFEGKSLRLLLQDLERFSVFLRVYKNLSFEEIFVAFHIIIENKSRVFNIQSEVQNRKRKIVEFFLDLNNIEESRHNEGDCKSAENADKRLKNIGLSDPSFCANIFIKYAMLQDRDQYFSSFERTLGYCCQYNEAFLPFRGHGMMIDTFPCQDWTTVENLLQPKLNFLEDFFVEPHQN